jgi:hypothetical protein
MMRIESGPCTRLPNGMLQHSLRLHVVADGDACRQQVGTVPRVAQGLHARLDVFVVKIAEERNEAANGPEQTSRTPVELNCIVRFPQKARPCLRVDARRRRPGLEGGIGETVLRSGLNGEDLHDCPRGLDPEVYDDRFCNMKRC